MSYFPDMGHVSMVASGKHVRAIGWLSSNQPYTTGDVSADFIRRLKEFAARSAESAEELYFGAFGGFHTCEFCRRVRGIGNFGVPRDSLLFIAPEMIVHYIEHHGYAPPHEFVEAVLHAPLPATPEYASAVAVFRQRHIDFLNALRKGSRGCESFTEL